MLRFSTAVLLVACFALTASAVTVSTTPSQCTGSTGTAMANASGGTPPYTYAWSNGGTTSQITGLAPGSYSVTVTDAVGSISSGSGVVGSSGLNNPFESGWVQPQWCPYGGWSVVIETADLGGTAPYSSVPPDVHSGGELMIWGGADISGYTVTITDANGCSVSFDIAPSWDYLGDVDLISTTPSCNSGANGTARIEVYGSGNSSINDIVFII